MSKDDITLEVCGTIDELSASLGMIRAEGLPTQYETIILRIQQELISFCADIVFDSAMILPEHVRQMESEIDLIGSELPTLTQFVIPGENRTSAMLHLSRTICRRAERSLVSLCHSKEKPPLLVAYLNRLSDLLFVMARKAAFGC